MKYIITVYSRDCDGVDVYTFHGTEKEMMERVRATALDIVDDRGANSVSFGWDTYGYPSYTAQTDNEDANVLVEAREWKYVRPLKVSRKNLYKAKKLEDDGWIDIEEEDD